MTTTDISTRRKVDTPACDVDPAERAEELRNAITVLAELWNADTFNEAHSEAIAAGLVGADNVERVSSIAGHYATAEHERGDGLGSVVDRVDWQLQAARAETDKLVRDLLRSGRAA